MNRVKVLFVCTYYGGRAKIAERVASRLTDAEYDFFSSGFESGVLGGFCLEVMKGEDPNFPTSPLKTIFERYYDGERFDHVITLCDDVTFEHCALLLNSVSNLFSNTSQLVHWSIPDFLSLEGSDLDKKDGAEKIRDSIKDCVSSFLRELAVLGVEL
jgi:protein-tyrosine-phosphatase